MFPETENGPARLSERVVGVAISQPVPLDFGAPVIGVCSRRSAVFGATVPKAAVDEDGDTLCRKDQVGGPTQAGYRPSADSISQTHRVDTLPNCEFRPRVPRAVGQHGAAHALARCPGFGHPPKLTPPGSRAAPRASAELSDPFAIVQLMAKTSNDAAVGRSACCAHATPPVPDNVLFMARRCWTCTDAGLLADLH
jgi:hypothetical protein